MKAAELGTLIRSYADALSGAGAVKAARSLEPLAQVLEEIGTPTVAATVKRMSTALAPTEHSRPDLSQLVPLLVPLQALLSLVAKTPAKDVGALVDLMKNCPSASLQDLARAATKPAKGKKSSVRQDVVNRYLSELESTMGKDEFGSVYTEISAASNLASAELLALAKGLSGASVRSRKDALKRIWNMHQEVVTSRKKIAATTGRTAA